jgi:diadenylate cyclase
VSSIFYLILILLRDTHGQTLMRGVMFLIILISLLTTLVDLPAFSWLVNTTLPALLFSIPVFFMPELRRGLERLGRAGSGAFLLDQPTVDLTVIEETVKSVVNAVARLAVFKQGALIVLRRRDKLNEYSETGVMMNASVSAELLLQIFHPNTPLHDGAVIIDGGVITSAACVLPLSASGVLSTSPERQMGLRHRAALGISEVSDAISVVVSEETGSISLTNRGRFIKMIKIDKLENILLTFFKNQLAADERLNIKSWLQRLINNWKDSGKR